SCSASGLKGPPTAAQRYVAYLTASETSDTVAAPEAARPSEVTELAPASTDEKLQRMLEEAAGLAAAKFRYLMENGDIAAGTELSNTVKLTGAVTLSYEVSGAVQRDAHGKPELVLE